VGLVHCMVCASLRIDVLAGCCCLPGAVHIHMRAAVAKLPQALRPLHTPSAGRCCWWPATLPWRRGCCRSWPA
jgi:hypothetical protein